MAKEIKLETSIGNTIPDEQKRIVIKEEVVANTERRLSLQELKSQIQLRLNQIERFNEENQKDRALIDEIKTTLGLKEEGEKEK